MADNTRRDMPVYLFTGFLEAGKTRFIQETLEDRRFCNGERTLLLVCEEGVEEYAPDQFADKCVKIRVIEDQSELTQETLARFEATGGIVAHWPDLSRVPRTLAVGGAGARAIRVMKRIDGGRVIWFVVNEDLEERPVELAFPTKGGVVRYDPERDALDRVDADGGTVRRAFAPGETAIYVTDECAAESTEETCVRASIAAATSASFSTTLALDAGWTLRPLVSHVAGAEDFEIRSSTDEALPVALGDWRGILGETFSGKALYRVVFDSNAEGDALLDLGEVKWCAAARMNGEDLGARFFGPFRWPVKIKTGRNVLEVTVANLLANQLGDDTIRDRILRDWQPNGSYDRFQRPFDKLNQESGLFGPVTLRVAHSARMGT